MNENPNTMIQDLTNGTEEMDTNSNIWTMFDDWKNTGGGKTKRKQSKRKLNEEQTRNDKRFKPSGELATDKQRIETTPTNTEPTCRTGHAGNVTTQHSKRKRDLKTKSTIYKIKLKN